MPLAQRGWYTDSMRAHSCLVSVAAGLSLLLLSCGARRPSEPSRTLRLSTTGSYFTSSNGYQYALIADPNARLARVDVRYPVGSADDPAGKEGLAHLVEHLMFEFDMPTESGTTSMFAEFGRVASYFNAMTTADYVHFESQGLPEVLPQLLELEAMRAAYGCKRLRPEIFEREKEVVLNELRQRLGPDGGDLRADIHAALYPPGHAYRSVSTAASVSSITLEDACLFMRDQFKRGRATVVVSGKFKEATVREIIAKSFDRIPSRLFDENPRVPVVSNVKTKAKIEGHVPEGVFMLAWPLPPEGTADFRFAQEARSVMVARLGSSAYTYEWGHSASSQIVGGGDAPFLILQVTLRSMKHVSDADDAARKAASFALRSMGPKGEGTDTVSWQLRLAEMQSALIGRYERPHSRAHMFCDDLLYEGKSGSLVAKLEELRETSPSRMRSRVEKWLAPSKAQVLIITPKKLNNRRLTLRGAFASGHSVRGIQVDPKDADAPLKIPAHVGLTLETTRYTTSNGLSVVLWPHGQMPLIHGRLVTSSGSAMDPKGAEGLAALTGLDSVFEESMVYWQGSVSTFVDSLVQDISYELRSPGVRVNSKDRKHLRSRLAVPGAVDGIEFETRMNRAIFGDDHPYARPSLTSGSIKSMTRDRVMDWARKHIVPKNSTLIFAGQFKEREIKNWIAYYSDQVSDGSDSKSITMPASPKTGPLWIGGRGDEGAPTVEVDIRFAGGRGIDRHYGARLVMAGILSSNLAKLREEDALSYGLNAQYVPQPAGGYWQIYGAVDAARAKEAGQKISELLRELRSGAGSYRSAFVLARRKRVDSLLASASDSNSVANRLSYMARFDLPDNYYDGLVQNIARLSLDEMQDLLRGELAAKNQVTGALGRESAVKAFLDGTKL